MTAYSPFTVQMQEVLELGFWKTLHIITALPEFAEL